MKELEKKALKVRENIVEISKQGGCFIGASLSCADVILYLYDQYLNIDPNQMDNIERDHFFLSKGHAVPAQYGVFVEKGWLSKERLANHLKVNDHIYLHPNRNIKPVDFHSGSLGHGLPLAVGVAIDQKLRKLNSKSVVLMGDGESNEGSNWEALLVAQAYQLDNLIVIVDRNQFQANMKTEDLIPLEKLEEKFKSFGCAVKRGDGHSYDFIKNTFDSIPFESKKPNVIIADTVRGKGIPSIEARADRWFYQPDEAEAASFIQELQKNNAVLV